jgi:hypothetical protein
MDCRVLGFPGRAETLMSLKPGMASGWLVAACVPHRAAAAAGRSACASIALLVCHAWCLAPTSRQLRGRVGSREGLGAQTLQPLDPGNIWRHVASPRSGERGEAGRAKCPPPLCEDWVRGMVAAQAQSRGKEAVPRSPSLVCDASPRARLVDLILSDCRCDRYLSVALCPPWRSLFRAGPSWDVCPRCCPVPLAGWSLLGFRPRPWSLLPWVSPRLARCSGERFLSVVCRAVCRFLLPVVCSAVCRGVCSCSRRAGNKHCAATLCWVGLVGCLGFCTGTGVMLLSPGC